VWRQGLVLLWVPFSGETWLQCSEAIVGAGFLSGTTWTTRHRRPVSNPSLIVVPFRTGPPYLFVTTRRDIARSHAPVLFVIPFFAEVRLRFGESRGSLQGGRPNVELAASTYSYVTRLSCVVSVWKKLADYHEQVLQLPLICVRKTMP